MVAVFLLQEWRDGWVFFGENKIPQDNQLIVQTYCWTRLSRRKLRWIWRWLSSWARCGIWSGARCGIWSGLPRWFRSGWLRCWCDWRNRRECRWESGRCCRRFFCWFFWKAQNKNSNGEFVCERSLVLATIGNKKRVDPTWCVRPMSTDRSRKDVRAWTCDAVDNKTTRITIALLSEWRKACVHLLRVDCCRAVCLLGHAEVAVEIVGNIVLLRGSWLKSAINVRWMNQILCDFQWWCVSCHFKEEGVLACLEQWTDSERQTGMAPMLPTQEQVKYW